VHAHAYKTKKKLETMFGVSLTCDDFNSMGTIKKKAY